MIDYDEKYYKDGQNKLSARRSSLVHKKKKYLLLRALADRELTRGCIDCGEKDPRVLDFDHVLGIKKTEVSKMVWNSASIASFYREVEKCEIRCANCHRRITARRKIEKAASIYKSWETA